MSARENKVGSHLISAIISQNEGNQAAFPSSVGGFLPPVPDVEDPSICRSLWGKCAISGLAYHPVRDRQAAIASSVWPTVDPPRKKYNALTPNDAGHNVLAITWCHEGPQIHWPDHANHARFHAMDGPNPYLQEDRQCYEATSEIGHQICAGRSCTLFGVPQQKQPLVRSQRQNIVAFFRVKRFYHTTLPGDKRMPSMQLANADQRSAVSWSLWAYSTCSQAIYDIIFDQEFRFLNQLGLTEMMAVEPL